MLRIAAVGKIVIVGRCVGISINQPRCVRGKRQQLVIRNVDIFDQVIVPADDISPTTTASVIEDRSMIACLAHCNQNRRTL